MAELREPAASMIQREIDARMTPPHIDGTYREGIFAGLQLALRIVTAAPDEDDVEVHRYPTCRVASVGRDRYLHGAYHPNGECPNGICAEPSKTGYVLVGAEMNWPDPEDARGVEWRLRYGNPTREDMLVAASYIAAYKHIVGSPTRQRNRDLAALRKVVTAAAEPVAPLTWEFCRSCGGAGWVGSRVDHKHPGCGHRCILCDPPPGYDRTYAVETA